MKKLKVLLVHDEEQFVETLADRLNMRNLDATTAHNGEDVLPVVKELEPDVIVLDLKMPGVDGIEVLKRVKEAYPSVEVIILTGHGSEKDEEAARRLGAFDYVKKPVDLDTLVPRIRNAFKKRMRTLEALSMSVAFAEEGDFDAAKEVMDDHDDQANERKRKEGD